MTGVNRRGFTVVELLVVVAIFAIGMLSIAATYINFTRLHRRVANAEALGQELRFLTELIVRSVRQDRVVYPALPAGLTTPSSQLQLLASNGWTVTVRKWGIAEVGSPCIFGGADCIALTFDGVNWISLTSKNINIDRFDVYVTPQKNPFEAVGFNYDNNHQPRVTFVIDASYINVAAQERAKLSVQTTVSSRVYVR